MSTRGIALAATLLLLPVLLILTTTLVKLTSRQNFGAQTHYRAVLAQQAAEGGLAHALAMLERDRNWRTTIDWQPLSEGEAGYRVVFAPDRSVNNLTGTTAVSGPRGPESVPPHTAWLVCEGRSHDVVRTLDVLVSQGSLNLEDVAMLAQGQIRAQGELSLDGLSSPGGEAIAAGIHTNLSAPSNGPSFHWSPLQTSDEANISGAVTSSDPRATNLAVRFDGVYRASSLRSREAQRRLPRFNIPSLVSQASREGRPLTLQPTETIVPPGKYFVAGPVNSPGSLVLQEGAEVYVDGDLDLSGSIRGKGSVVVDGNTHLRGDVQLSAGNKVALLSQGDVHLEGYDAKQYLHDVPGAAQIASNINRAMQRIAQLGTTGELSVIGSNGALDQANHVLNTGTGATFDALPANQLVALRDLLNLQPAEPRRDFLLKRLDQLIPYHDHGGGTQLDRVNWVRSFLQNPSTDTPKVLEALSDDYGNLRADLGDVEIRKALRLVAQIARTVQGDGLTSSYFEGLIYTEGRLRADKEVNLVGALVSGQDIELNRGIHLTYLQSLFDQEDPIAVPGLLSVRTWILR